MTTLALPAMFGGWAPALRRRRPPPAADARGLVAASDLFDEAWYRATQMPDLPPHVDAARHYLEHGVADRLSPSSAFDAPRYLADNPDVAQAGVQPLVHFLQHGRAEGRRHCGVADAADIRLIRDSGLLDPAWICARVAGLREADAAAYYLKEWRRGLSPGPLFDAAWYLSQAADVAAFDDDPLLHYLRHGRAEGRSTRNVGAASDDATRPTRAVSLPLKPVAAVPIAVVIHAFYPELLDEMFAQLAAMPMPFTLLVGVPSEADRRAVEVSVAQGGLNLGRLVCRVMPNRGRNFATFCAFSREILAHRLVLHLHTKRSLYTGGDQAEWRRSLQRGLIGSAPLIRVVLDLFEQDPQLGLFYPATAPHLPYWAHHWLSNQGEAARLFERLHIAPPRRRYLDYPVGGMFWARVEALRPLLRAGIGHDDFAPEAGQTDGTLAHAIERAIGVVALAQGYSFTEYACETGTLRDGWSARNLHQYVGTTLTRFTALLAASDLVSFDLFDTLLTRPVLAPDAVLRLVGHVLQRQTNGPPDFFERRKNAEGAARRRKSNARDVSLADIYAAFAPDEIWTRPRIAAACTLECETDAACLRPRPGAADMLAAAKAAGVRIILISDTYYEGPRIAALLAAAGLPSAFDAVYLSCEIGARKDRGDLWAHVQAHEAAPPERWLHVGDNEHSDIQAACDRGLRFFHVMAPADLLEADGFVPSTTPDAARWPAELVIGPAMLRLAGPPFRDRGFRQTRLRDAREVGYVVFGPIMFVFMAWLVRHPARRCVAHLRFLSREGFLLHRLYTSIADRYPHLALPPASYLHASRRSSLAAAQAVCFRPERILAGARFRGSLQALLLHRIGLDLPPAFGAADWIVDLPRDEAAVLASLRVLREQIVAHGSNELPGLLAHAREHGLCGPILPGPGLQGVVDIGYSASIQRNLQESLGRPLVGFYLGSFRAAEAVEERQGYAFGCLAEGIDPWTSAAPALRHSLVMEAFLTAPHGQVLAFRAGPPAAPILKAPTLDAAAASLLADMHDGAAAYCAELLDTFGPDLLLAEIEPDMPQQFLRMLMDAQLRLPPELAGWFSVEDDYCGSGHLQLAI